ncbi:MAG TPA: type I secretion system permease/ATPase [Aurantimonas coralicida]|uniref:Type I secretion system permease/ATPase n=2 Tax=root TaxID=1 RepID=A0A9C9NEP1_9HYPH|nr:type I secretion system permease/ATPase [Aurantimonas coralicida]HEU00146.1 type I secretion system permease/ATPase [Aurantimonas coralicida]
MEQEPRLNSLRPSPEMAVREAAIFDDMDSAIADLCATAGVDRSPSSSMKTAAAVLEPKIIEGAAGEPVLPPPAKPGGKTADAGQPIGRIHPRKARSAPDATPLQTKQSAVDFRQALAQTRLRVRANMTVVLVLTFFTNILVLAIPIYLFQISDRVMTSRSVDTLLMLTIVVIGAIVGQVLLDACRRLVLMRTAVEVEARLGSPILSAAARSSLGGNGKDYQVLGDMQHVRSFLTGATLIAMLDAPLAPIFILAVWIIHPHLGAIIIGAVLLLLLVAWLNKRATAQSFADASGFGARSNLVLDALARNSQIVNALGMIPEAVRMWGRDNASSLSSQVKGQDRNVMFSSLSRAVRLFTQVAILGWGAYLSLGGSLTGGMVIAASIIAGRALAPVEGTIEGWRTYSQSKTAYHKITNLLLTSPLNVDRLRLPTPQGRLDVDRVLYVPPPSKKVILNGVSFSLKPGESLGIIGSSGAGKSTIGKMLVGSVFPTAGSIRLDLMDLKNWDPRQLGENIGYLPQDVQLFPASIKANIARMRDDASDESVFEAASMAGIHELVASFPQGYETIIAADGAPLSGGQKQRIGLARAFFGNPRLVVLDEPNSNLDTEGEKALADAMRKAQASGTTVVAITQRHSLLQCVDRVMIMEKGAVAAIGDRSKIMAMITGKKSGEQPSKGEVA